MELVMVARSEPIDEDAVPTILFVFAFIPSASDVDAVVTVEFMLEVAELMSTLVASDPEVSPAPVRVRVA